MFNESDVNNNPFIESIALITICPIIKSWKDCKIYCV